MKVVRLNEKDIENLVRRIIKEEKTIKEGPVDWVRSKFNKDEDLALLIYKGINSGNVEDLRGGYKEGVYYFRLDGHSISIKPTMHKSPEKKGRFVDLPQLRILSDNYLFKLDGEVLHVSESLKRKIWELLKKIENPRGEKNDQLKSQFIRPAFSSHF